MPTDVTITGREVVEYAATIGKGRPYILGAVGPNAYDCSGLILAVFKHFAIATFPNLPREAGAQARWLAVNGKQISIAAASNTPGAVLAIDKGPSGSGAGGNHIGFCRSPGVSFEARSPRYGIGSWPLNQHRWTGAYLIPNIDYSLNLEDDVFTPVVIPANAQPDPNGRFPFYRLMQVGSAWHVRGVNGARFAANSPGFVADNDVALPVGLSGPPVGMAESGGFVVVVAEDGGTFAYPMVLA